MIYNKLYAQLPQKASKSPVAGLVPASEWKMALKI